MAGRKAQHDADYFPFFAKDGRTLFMLQNKFGLEGIGFFTNLLRLLCTTPYHYLDLKDPMEALYTWSKIGLNDETKAEAMLDLMVTTGKIDRELWRQKRVVYSQAFVDSLAELYAKRKEKPLTLDDIRGMNGISAPEMTISAPEMTSKHEQTAFPGSSIRKGKERKESKGEFAGPPEAAQEILSPEPTPQEPEFNPIAVDLAVPPELTLSANDLEELQQRFGSRSQEAIGVIALRFQSTRYGYKSHWAGVKSWLAKEPSPLVWLDKAVGKGPKPWEVPQAAPADTRTDGLADAAAKAAQAEALKGFNVEGLFAGATRAG